MEIEQTSTSAGSTGTSAGYTGTRAGTRAGSTGASKDQWKKEITTTNREIYLFEPIQKGPGPKDKSKPELPIFHHILAPAGTDNDAWYYKTSFAKLSASSAFNFQPATAYTIYGASENLPMGIDQIIYVSLRYIRFAIEYPMNGVYPGGPPQLFTGELMMPQGRRVSKNYGGENITPQNPENEGLITLDDSEVSKDFNRKLITAPYPNTKNAEKISISEILQKLQIKLNSRQFHFIPFRTGDGTLYWGQAEKGLDQVGGPDHHYNKWLALLNTRTKVSVSGNKRTWRMRYDDRDLKTPLIVKYTKTAENRFKDKGYDEVPIFMAKLVKAINDIYKTPKENPRTNQLELDVSEQHLSDYCLLSENPFGLFQTYIHKTEIQSYMEDLALNLQQPKAEDVASGKALHCSPLRSLPIENDFEKSMYDYFKELAGGGEALDPDSEDEEDAKTGEEAEEVLAQLDGGQQVGGTNQNLGRMEEETSGASKKNNSLPLKGNGVKPESSQKGEEFKESKLLKLFPKEPQDGGWRHSSKKHESIVLSSRKIIEAKGTRKTQKSQRDVMGLSASGLAERVFKWTPPDHTKTGCKRRQPSNGLYMAEWLHLCAYSWGGLNPDGDQNNLGSSQTADNLVFGSSEANSCMTRYESAWQSLFTDEANLIGKMNGSSKDVVNIKGRLEVQRNPQGKKRNHDKIDEDFQYSWEEVELPGDDSHLAKFAARAKLLAYTIDYKPQIDGYKARRPLILDRSGSSVSESTVFHPFSRRFFHRAEYLLDAALYEAMYRITAYDKLEKYDRTTTDLLVNERFPYTNKLIKAVLNDRDYHPGAKQKACEKENLSFFQQALTIRMPPLSDFPLGQSGTSPNPFQHYSGQSEDPSSQGPKKNNKNNKGKGIPVPGNNNPDPGSKKKLKSEGQGQNQQHQQISPYGGQGGNPFGSPYGNQGGSPYGNQSGNPYGSQGGNPYGNQGGNPYGSQGGNQYGGQGGGQGSQGNWYGGSQS
ncbi:hypothetical protein TWF225_001769 [Orbilia oligospora]|nr:hypothetical protein TWF225_001769 [Orbilia oligospora]KAF3255719.1 hypothetical protein TWF217_006537 [Orbilia oligospora]KAF3265143.1 hypothetical protein TWF128_000439 [Orbilia oligospora]KAF3278427.1 hypothetical protein TWF132_001144 [Orbilia oligospora]